ncbi:MAG: 16S rRNA (cytosine(1402)-N(4))-methyltransferase RsmH [Myxococcales bacterium]|nr:16S rRNA (cytosine(1402)-N(4))-methyltransferase RsmH [Myxococcales bacterium]
MEKTFHHVTVLRDEAVALLRGRPGLTMLDGTLGGGGHAQALLESGARVIGLDRDPRALAAASARLAAFGDRFQAVPARFSLAREVLDALGVARVDGLLLDLGVSSPQFDEASRGFSFAQDGPLDMRMGAEGESAAQLIARLSEAELADVIFELGEEPHSRRIARAIKRVEPLPTTTHALARLVSDAIPRAAWPKKIHPATRTFQALRIAVNHELEELDAILDALPALLAPEGRAAIISFHSLEDRKVKARFRDLERRCACPPGMPVCGCGRQPEFRALTRRAITASDAELDANPRARSAHLRAIERLP